MNETTIGLAPYCGPRRRLCSIDGCENKHYAVGFCERHYIRLKRHSNPLTVIANEDRRHVRLSPEKVTEIMKLREAGLTQKAIAKVFDVDRTTVSKVVCGSIGRA